ncbi:MAG: 2-(1,2-epoxy-1,2-dihydrophenyl)acetyl-CoA isomerase [Bdellovibrionales bacterium]|nr:2-(1,2-epoxy-1,2-dihydrophenyl)acetyl-CoA isomerase [Bdellovibrionales bacterium]
MKRLMRSGRRSRRSRSFAQRTVAKSSNEKVGGTTIGSYELYSELTTESSSYFDKISLKLPRAYVMLPLGDSGGYSWRELMSSQLILVNIKSGVAEVTLNRPDKLNSLTHQMSEELLKALQDISQDKKIRSILLCGAGRAFCAGQDLKEVSPARDGSLADFKEIVLKNYNPIITLIREIEVPVVCAVQGVAAGAGANLALACDFVLASTRAKFVQSFANVGLIPDSGGTFFLPRLIGLARATALAMLAEEISAESAEQIGLIYQVCDHEKLMDKARQLAVRLASAPTKGLALTKRLLNQSFSNSLVDQLVLEADYQGEAGRSDDYREGVSAFLQKRPAVFKGS